MSLFTLGISHQTAPISIRERLAFAAETLPEALSSLSAIPGVEGCSILSTCNRTELYVSSEQAITRSIMDWLHEWHGLAPGHFREHVYQLEHGACTYHLIKVISGMDSMIIGEPQVAGQAKQAWQQAQAANTLDSRLDRMFQHAFAAAKRVRSETGIGRDPVTLPFAALRLARQIFGGLDSLRVLLIGAGEMIEDCATHFHASGMNTLTIANRSAERAGRLAERFNARSATLDTLPELLGESDLVIACTASPSAIIDRQMIRDALKTRRRQPMFALDLSVPRNISADAGNLDDLYLYTIDDLRAIVESAQQQRQEALQQANAIVESEVATFERWLRLQSTSSTLKSLRQQAQGERDRLLERARQELERGADPEDVMRRLSHRLVNRLLHGPSIRIRQAAEAGDEELLAAARFYFTDENS
ncbi:glutamyl-tRNA reductase [Wenzhouxiangella sediminis]|uniref:Glutamyl-tRNA reductase n=1 Tax=Wenzhouxiangella sediminis TaxID=1792836 RepID=A0A3E1KC71_9GAMM|nr:glutamyl-tRNA reductase [Wenzhouxiangella sediminis]RFF32323.1 glutamyl-tRNA reductase [Wenzhouxiangella sediminis]